jgi:hypothetical protein
MKALSPLFNIVVILCVVGAAVLADAAKHATARRSTGKQA